MDSSWVFERGPGDHGWSSPGGSSVAIRELTADGNEWVCPYGERLAARAYLHHAFSGGMMTFILKSITVRDVPDETCEGLAARAALAGRSLQEVPPAEQPDSNLR